MNLLVNWYPGDAAVVFAGQVVVEITAVIALAGLFSFFALRRRPAARHALWLGTLIAVALAPLTLTALERTGWFWSVHRPAMLRESAPAVAPPAMPIVMKGSAAAAQTLDDQNSPESLVPESADITTATLSAESDLLAAAPPAQNAADIGRSLTSAGVVLWLFGTAFLLARLLRGDRQVRRLLADIQPIEPGCIDEALAIAAGTLGTMRLPPIVTSTAVAGPVVAGLIRPTVVLPVALVRTADVARLADVLVHECAHAVRHDPWIGLAQRLVQLAFWPHPFVYFMNRCLTRAREEVCDNYVLRRGDAVCYAQTLLELATRYDAQPLPGATLAIFTPRWKLEDRVAGLLDPRRQHGTRFGSAKFATLAALLIVGGSALGAARFAEPVPKGAAGAAEPEKPAAAAAKPLPASEKALLALDKPTTVHFIDLPLEDALTFLKDYHDIAMRFDREAIQAVKVSLDHPVAVKGSGVSLRSVLKLLLEPLALDMYVGEEGLVVTTRAKAATQFSDFSYSAPHQLAEFVHAGISLTDLAEAITQTVDPVTWKKNGGEGTLRVEKGGFLLRQRSDVRGHIDDLLRDLRFAVRDAAAVTDDERLETREYAIGDLKGAGLSDDDIFGWLQKALLIGESPINGDKEGAAIMDDKLILKQPGWKLTAVRDPLAFLNSVAKEGRARPELQSYLEFAATMLPFEARRRILGKRLLQPANVDFVDLPLEDSLTFLEDYGNLQIQIAEPLRGKGAIGGKPVNLKADKEPLSRLLDELLSPLKLDWYVLDPDVVVVTTRADAISRMETRVYRIKEALAAGKSEKALLTRIAAMEPESWEPRGGPGRIRSLPGGLIVTHNYRIHSQIERYLGSFKTDQRQPAK